MTASSKRAALPDDNEQPVAATPPPADGEASAGQRFDILQWHEADARREFRGAGGRAVLGWALAILAALWIAYCAWAAGRALSGQPLSSPLVAQWLAFAAGPLALLGLAWIMFGRTRRREAEQFTRSVVEMRAEARSLEALLDQLTRRIDESRESLSSMSQQLVRLGDETAGRFDGITRDLDNSTERLARHGESIDRAAEAARIDIGVLLDDLPRAEASARTMAEQLRQAGSEATAQAQAFELQVASLSERTGEAETIVSEAAQRLVSHLTHIESSGAAAAERVGQAGEALSVTVDESLGRAAEALDRIRAGVDDHSAAVSALVDKASAGMDRAGSDAADALAASVGNASDALEKLNARVAEQEAAFNRIARDTAQALADLDTHFSLLADQGDQRSAAFVAAIGQARGELHAFGEQTGAEEGRIEGLQERLARLQDAVERLGSEVRDQLSVSLDETQAGTERLLQTVETARPEIDWMREAAGEASERIASSAAGIAEQQDRFAALLASIDEGVEGSGNQLDALARKIAEAQAEAGRLSEETAPALVAALVQVREASAHAAQRAREAIAAVIPQAAEQLSSEAREALERTLKESVEDRLAEMETLAARAVESARSASDRLTQQMLSLGQSAVALEQHMETSRTEQRERDSEAFARRVSLLIDSMHSAAIDVGKILSNEVEEKDWESYLKGNRGIFTRRAVRLLDGEQLRALRAHYETDGEFQQSVNRYVHDFEAMLRRVLAERDGGLIAVTLMSSDMGKLYAALAEAIDHRR